LANSGLLMAALVAEGEEVASINMVGVCGCTVCDVGCQGHSPLASSSAPARSST
jgi:hypothetical protein